MATPPKRTGRPSKYTKALGDQAVELAREGTPRRWIAKSIGVHNSTLYDWVALGEAELLRQEQDAAEDRAPDLEERRYPELADWVLLFGQAEAEFGMGQMRRLANAKNGDEAAQLRAAMFLLERRFPGDFGARTAHELQGPDGGPMQHQVTGAVIFLPAEDAPDDDEGSGGDRGPAGASAAPG